MKEKKKYEQIVEDIKRKIQNNDIFPGDKLPTENQLMQEYQVSKTTIYKALTELEKIHLVYRKQGSGTFITKSMTNRQVFFTEHNRFSSTDVQSTELSNIEESKKRQINQILKTSELEKVFVVERIKLVNGQPYAFQSNYIPERYFKKFDFVTTKKGISISKNFYQHFQINTFETKFDETIQMNDQVSTKILNKLKLSIGTPVIHFYKKSYLDDQVYEVIETYLNYKYYQLNLKSII